MEPVICAIMKAREYCRVQKFALVSILARALEIFVARSPSSMEVSTTFENNL